MTHNTMKSTYKKYKDLDQTAPFKIICSRSKLLDSKNLKFWNNWIYFQGNNPAILISDLILSGNQLINERICSPRSEFYSLRAEPIIAGYLQI